MNIMYHTIHDNYIYIYEHCVVPIVTYLDHEVILPSGKRLHNDNDRQNTMLLMEQSTGKLI